MKPRIFVSSTFYDLKYIREDLSNFIKAHDFESVLFENGDIGYTPYCALDESCYEDMKNADLVMLIIGGHYGSAATGEDKNFKEYVSITKNEFRIAISHQVPVFCFIDKEVKSEYEIYKINKSKLESDNKSINFKVVKNINVFRFIEEISTFTDIPIIGFENSEDIKSFMSKQWANMFKCYLLSLKENKTSEMLNSTVESMDTILKQMKIMVDKIGEDTIKEKDDYTSIVDEQMLIELEKVLDKLTKNLSIEINDAVKINEKEKNVENLLNGMLEKFTAEKNSNISLIKYVNVTECVLSYSIYDPLVKKFVINEKRREKLKEFMIKEPYYSNIFTQDIRILEPDWDEEKAEFEGNNYKYAGEGDDD